MDEKKWEEVRRQVEEEIEKARRRAMVAESFDEAVYVLFQNRIQ